MKEKIGAHRPVAQLARHASHPACALPSAHMHNDSSGLQSGHLSPGCSVGGAQGVSPSIDCDILLSGGTAVRSSAQTSSLAQLYGRRPRRTAAPRCRAPRPLPADLTAGKQYRRRSGSLCWNRHRSGWKARRCGCYCSPCSLVRAHRAGSSCRGARPPALWWALASFRD